MFIYLDHPSDSPWGKSNASRHVRGKSSGGVFCPLTEDSKVCEWNHKMALVPRYASVFRVPPYASFLRYLHNLVILFAVNLLPSFSIQKN